MEEKLVTILNEMAEYLSIAQMKKLQHTRGATLQQINLSDLRVHMIPVPPIESQEKLADFSQQVDKSKLLQFFCFPI